MKLGSLFEHGGSSDAHFEFLFLKNLTSRLIAGSSHPGYWKPESWEHWVDSPQWSDTEETSEPGSPTSSELFPEHVDHIGLQFVLEVVKEDKVGWDLTENNKDVVACEFVLHFENDDIS